MDPKSTQSRSQNTIGKSNTGEPRAIAAAALAKRLGSAEAPLLIDVRREATYADSPHLIAGAIRRDPEKIEDWIADLPRERSIVVYCAHGLEIGREAARRLAEDGRDAAYLSGGIEDWLTEGRPKRGKSPYADGIKPSLWVTRARPKIDRIACPWLIARFIDPLAQFLYVPAGDVFAIAETRGAVAFDIPGAAFSHVGEACSFDAFVAHFDLQAPGLDRLAKIIRGADTSRLDLAPESAGLYAISLGLGDLVADDQALCAAGFTIYDALYRQLRDLSEETHSWPPRLS